MAAASIDRHDVTNTIVARARRCRANILEIGVAFALWGDRTPLARVAEALDRPLGKIEQAVQQLQRRGIVKVTDAELSFMHDRLRVGLLDGFEPGREDRDRRRHGRAAAHSTMVRRW